MAVVATPVKFSHLPLKTWTSKTWMSAICHLHAQDGVDRRDHPVTVSDASLLCRRHVGDESGQTMQRMTVAEAADALGVTRDAVRKRIKRGSIVWENGTDGETYVYVDASATSNDGVGDMSANASPLVGELKDRVRFLEKELEDRKEETRRLHHLLAGALERIPALEESLETRGSSLSASEEGVGGTGPLDDTGQSRRPWWRRWFG